MQVESRPSKKVDDEHDFLVNLGDDDNLEDVCQKIMSNLKPVVQNLNKHGGETGTFCLTIQGKGLLHWVFRGDNPNKGIS